MIMFVFSKGVTLLKMYNKKVSSPYDLCRYKRVVLGFAHRIFSLSPRAYPHCWAVACLDCEAAPRRA